MWCIFGLVYNTYAVRVYNLSLAIFELLHSTNMPHSSQNQSSSSSTYVEKSHNHYYSPFGGYMNFMHSYGLKHFNPDDVEEGKRIIQGFRDLDRFEWEEAQKTKKAGRK